VRQRIARSAGWQSLSVEHGLEQYSWPEPTHTASASDVPQMSSTSELIDTQSAAHDWLQSLPSGESSDLQPGAAPVAHSAASSTRRTIGDGLTRTAHRSRTEMRYQPCG